MQHGYFKKKMVWRFDPTPGVEGMSVGKIVSTIVLHASSALIWYETWPFSEKKFNFDLCLTPKITPGDLTQAFRILFDMFFIFIAPLPACKMSTKILTTALVIAKGEE